VVINLTWANLLRIVIAGKKKNTTSWIRSRQDLHRLCALFDEPRIAVSSLDQMLKSKLQVSVRITALERSAYNLTERELIALCAVVRSAAPSVLLEFGTFDGRSTLHLALNSPEHSIVYTVDIQAGEFDFNGDQAVGRKVKIGESFSGDAIERKIVSLTGDTATVDFSAIEGKVDLVFIDADHSYEAVSRDSRLALRLLSKTGSIIWHDYRTISGVTRAIDELASVLPLESIADTTLVVYRPRLTRN
jgi:predicted O-methyltransferase YrrM